MKILIADPSVHIAKRLMSMIQTENMAAIIYHADNCDSARKLFRQNKPRVVLLEINCPENGSLDFLQFIKESGHQTNIIVLSDFINNVIMEQCKSFGVNVFLDKYFEFEKIPGIINAIAVKK